MCGQLGYSGVKPFDSRKIALLAYLNAFERGMDSTGIYSPKNGLFKTKENGCDVFTLGKHTVKEDNLLMAHFRAATVGNKEVKNAHPFQRGRYILQHNGTLTNHWDILKKYNLNFADYWVDSDVICGAIEACGDITEVLKQINGGAAIIIHDIEQPNRLYVFRNKERPLWKGYIDGQMYISSIWQSLFLIGCIAIKEFKPDTLYTIEEGAIKQSNYIKNTPYKTVSKNNSNNYSSNNLPITTNSGLDNNIYKLVGSLVRANTSCTFYRNKVELKLIKNEYYIIEGANVKTQELLVKRLGIDGSCFIHKSNFFFNEDIIDTGTYCKVKWDIYEDLNKANIIFSKGAIVKCLSSYFDGTAIVCSAINNSRPSESIRKMALVRLTEEEEKAFRLEYLKNSVNLLEQLDVPFVDSETNLSEETDIIINDDSTLDEPADFEDDILTGCVPAKPENIDDFFDTLVNNDELSDYFTDVNSKIEDLYLALRKYNVDKVVGVNEAIAKLTALNFEGFEAFTIDTRDLDKNKETLNIQNA